MTAPKTELYPYQRRGVDRIQWFGGRALLADEVGLGKTLQSLYWAWRYLPDDPPGPVVVVAPAHLKLVWEREARKHLGWRVDVLNRRRVSPGRPPPVDPNGVLVVNDEILVPPHWKPRTAPPRDSWLAWLLSLRPRLVIADEAHRLSNPTAARTRAVRRLMHAAPHALALTGTPLWNRVPGLWSVVNLVRPDLFPSRVDFLENFTHMRQRPWGRVSEGAKNLDKLHDCLVSECLIRRRKCDVLDLPPVVYDVKPVEADLREYRKAEDDFLGWLDETHPELSASARQAEQLTRMTFLRGLAGRLKVDDVARWAKDLVDETGGKLLVGAVHYAVTGPLMKAFGRRAVLVDGRQDYRTKDAGFEAFNRDPRVKFLVGNIDAAGTGWSCTSTSDVALAELPWRPADLAQFVGRVHGVGRGLPGCQAHARLLVSAGTIEEDICEVLQKKFNWAAAAIDGDAGMGLNVYDMVADAMRARRAG